MNLKKVMTITLVLIMGLSVLAGCSSNQSASGNGKADQYIAIVGSTSVTPVATELAERFMANNEGVKIDVQGIGSSAGIKAAFDKTANIGMSSRNLKMVEKEWGLKEVVIAYDGIAVSVHPSNPIVGMTKDQVKDIFEGTITNWSELGGKDAQIIIVSREDGSGTRGAFEELIGLEAEDGNGNKYSTLVQDAMIADGNGAVKANVASKEDAIGYLSLSYIDESVKTLNIDESEPTVKNIKAGDYKISRPFLMLLNDESSIIAKEFIDFVLSDAGQAIVSEKLIGIE